MNRKITRRSAVALAAAAPVAFASRSFAQSPIVIKFSHVVANDTPNFAPKGNIVAQVPTGTGVMVLANRDVHVFENQIDNNATAAVMLVSYTQSFTDASYNPLPRDITVRNNHFGKNGFDPKFLGGPLLAKATGGTIPPLLWDGVTSYPGKTEPVRVRFADLATPCCWSRTLVRSSSKRCCSRSDSVLLLRGGGTSCTAG